MASMAKLAVGCGLPKEGATLAALAGSIVPKSTTALTDGPEVLSIVTVLLSGPVTDGVYD